MNEALTELNELGGNEFLRDVIGAFLDSGPRQLRMALESLQASRAVPLARAVHSLKSSALQLGEAELSTLCARAESLTQSGRMDEETARILQEVARALDAACDRLRGVAGALPP